MGSKTQVEGLAIEEKTCLSWEGRKERLAVVGGVHQVRGQNPAALAVRPPVDYSAE